ERVPRRRPDGRGAGPGAGGAGERAAPGRAVHRARGRAVPRGGPVNELFPGLTLGKATRDAYGEALRDLGREHDDIVVLDADLAKSTKSAMFGEEFPDRFFNVGIQEANMV